LSLLQGQPLPATSELPCGAVFFDFAGEVWSFRVDDTATATAGDGFRGTALAANRFDGLAGAISMPNISDRSPLASTSRQLAACRLSLVACQEIGSRRRDQVLLIDFAYATAFHSHSTPRKSDGVRLRRTGSRNTNAIVPMHASQSATATTTKARLYEAKTPKN
jgi:hypothetical protein